MRKKYEFSYFHKQKIEKNLQKNLHKSRDYIHTGRLLALRTTESQSKMVSQGGSPKRDASTLTTAKKYNILSIERRSLKPLKISQKHKNYLSSDLKTKFKLDRDKSTWKSYIRQDDDKKFKKLQNYAQHIDQEALQRENKIAIYQANSLKTAKELDQEM